MIGYSIPCREVERESEEITLRDKVVGENIITK